MLSNAAERLSQGRTEPTFGFGNMEVSENFSKQCLGGAWTKGGLERVGVRRDRRCWQAQTVLLRSQAPLRCGVEPEGDVKQRSSCGFKLGECTTCEYACGKDPEGMVPIPVVIGDAKSGLVTHSPYGEWSELVERT